MNLIKKVLLKLNSLVKYLGIPKHEIAYIDRYYKRKTKHIYYIEVSE